MAALVLTCVGALVIPDAIVQVVRVASARAVQFGLAIPGADVQPVSDAVIERTVDTLLERMEGIGVPSPEVVRSDAKGEAIRVTVPSLGEVDSARFQRLRIFLSAEGPERRHRESGDSPDAPSPPQ